MSRLITTSLLSSIDWFNNCPPDWKDKAFKDLNNTLARIWTTPNPAAQRGMTFEKLLYDVLRRGNENRVTCSDKFKEVMKACKGGIFQKKIKKFIEIDGNEYCLFGKLDVDLPEKIIDIKTTGNYKGRMNYLKSMQHKLYCYITKKSKFEYIIAEFYGDSGPIEKVHYIPYEVDYWEKIEEEIIEKIREAINFLKTDEEIFELYTTKYSLY